MPSPSRLARAPVGAVATSRSAKSARAIVRIGAGSTSTGMSADGPSWSGGTSAERAARCSARRATAAPSNGLVPSSRSTSSSTVTSIAWSTSARTSRSTRLRPAASIARRRRPAGQAAVTAPLSSRSPTVARASPTNRSSSSRLAAPTLSASTSRAAAASSSSMGSLGVDRARLTTSDGQLDEGEGVDVVAGDEPPAVLVEEGIELGAGVGAERPPWCSARARTGPPHRAGPRGPGRDPSRSATRRRAPGTAAQVRCPSRRRARAAGRSASGRDRAARSGARSPPARGPRARRR